MKSLTVKTLFAAFLLAGAWGVSASPALALPAMDHGVAARAALGAEKARWVCGPYRCWWRPGPYYWGPRWGYYRPRWGWGPRWGYYRRGWRRW